MVEIRISGSDREVDVCLSEIFASKRYDVCNVSKRHIDSDDDRCWRYVTVMEAPSDRECMVVEAALSAAVGVKLGDIVSAVAESHPEWNFEFSPVCMMRFDSVEDAPDPGEVMRLSRYSVGPDGVVIGACDLAATLEKSASGLVDYFASHGKWEWGLYDEFAWGDCDISSPGISVAVRRYGGTLTIVYEHEEFIDGYHLSSDDCWDYIRTA